MRFSVRSVRTLGMVLCLCLAAAHAAGQAPAKRPITHDVYAGWRSIQGTRVSPDGAWLAYALILQEGDGELVVRNLASGVEHRYPRGREPRFTVDGRFVVFTVAPPKAEVDKAKKDRKKPEDQPKAGLGVMALPGGDVFTADRVRSVKVPEESARFIAYLLEPPEKKAAARDEAKEPEARSTESQDRRKKEKKKEPGTDLIVRELATGNQIILSEVVEYAWPKDGTWLAYGVSSKSPEKDGAFARRAADGLTKTLAQGLGNYKGFAWSDDGKQLAFVSDRDTYKEEPSTYALYGWTAGGDAVVALAARATKGLPDGMTVSENGRLEFSHDGARLFFGFAPVPKPEPDDAPEPVKVDLWSWNDAELQPMQKARADEEKKRSYRAVVHIRDRRVVALGGPDLPTITLSEDGAHALGETDVPYRKLASWDRDYNDYYLVGVQDGKRQQVLEKAPFDATLSPGGTYVIYFDAAVRAWFSYRIADGSRVNLSGKLGVVFDDEKWDTPDLPRPYGVAGWTEGDRSLLLYDRYDIWEIRPDGSGAQMITGGTGRANRIVFRYVRLDEEQKAIPAGLPLLLRAVDETTKASGFYRAALGAAAPVKLVMLDKAFGMPVKARKADALVVTESRFEEFPDLWFGDLSFRRLTKVTDANPQQAEFVWGRSELIDYRDGNGKPMRAILTRPDTFDPSKRYPLMVYIYEELTDTLHRYIPPAPGTSINITRYVSNGYVVLQPDIEYEVGYPGESAMRCVIPAVQRVLEMGFIDPARVGIQGHSWGGYQITYMITRTNIFRAVEAGASVSDMISAYGGIRWGTGMSRAFQYEHTQSRIGGTPWTSPLQFIENSPIFWVERIRTPYLTIHNDEDDAVPWYQGIEFITAMRRLGKEAWMFSFNGEKHGLRDRENQKYWTVHMAEFFDHYLLGAPRPAWMDSGVPYLERGTRDLSGIYGGR